VVREVLSIVEFRGILLAVFVLVTSFTLVGNLGFYINVYFLFGGHTDAAAALQGTAAVGGMLAGVVACPLIGYLARKAGMWTTLFVFMLLAFIGQLSYWWTARPAWPYVSVLSGVLCNLGLVAFWIFMPSLTGEISNLYEKRTGKSLYGSFSALYSVSLKLAASCALLLTGFILNLTGFQASLGNSQAPWTLTCMRILSAVVPASGIVLALVFLLKTRTRISARGSALRQTEPAPASPA
jgi:GPH family glycoside/pentoside/hexuronide:cation symporter